MSDSHVLKTRKSSLSIFHMNIRSTPRNVDAMSDYIYCLNVDFHLIGISETWLKEDNCGLYDIPRYHCKEIHKPWRVGGGVAIYVSDFVWLIPRVELSVSNDLVEIVFTEIYGGDLTDGKNVVVGEVYRSQTTTLLNSTWNKGISQVHFESVKRNGKAYVAIRSHSLYKFPLCAIEKESICSQSHDSGNTSNTIHNENSDPIQCDMWFISMTKTLWFKLWYPYTLSLWTIHNTCTNKIPKYSLWCRTQ